MTLGQEIAEAERILAEAGIDTPRADAEWIACAVLGTGRAAVASNGDQPLPDDAAQDFSDLIARRAKREPLAYVVGTAGFRGLELEVGPGVLVPRPETEVTAERAIARVREHGKRPTVVDVGTGSGCIALSIAAEAPEARIFATEASGAARGWALRNLARTGLRVTLLPGDLLSPMHPALGGGLDVVVSNPPYVPAAAWDDLPPEVRRYEPREAIIGGETGLEVIGELIEQTRLWIAPGGWLILEIAEDAAGRVVSMLQAASYVDIAVTDDLAGRPRVVEARYLGVL